MQLLVDVLIKRSCTQSRIRWCDICLLNDRETRHRPPADQSATTYQKTPGFKITPNCTSTISRKDILDISTFTIKGLVCRRLFTIFSPLYYFWYFNILDIITCYLTYVQFMARAHYIWMELSVASIRIRWMRAAPLFRTHDTHTHYTHLGRIRQLSNYRTLVIFSCRYEFRIRSEGKQLISQISELLISQILTKLHVIYWQMYTGGLRFWLYCDFSSTILPFLQGLTIIVSTGSGAPEDPSYPVPGGISRSPWLRGS